MECNEFIRETIFSRFQATFTGTITRVETDAGVFVDFDGENARIGFQTKAQEARCYFHLATCEGKPFTITETPIFDTCGPMLEMSGGAVMTVESIKVHLEKLAALGINMVMLYTEDTYTIPEYEHFGHMRGRYTLEELQEIDDYADALGIEVIPCIQTLGHLNQFIKWPQGKAISNGGAVLLVGDEKTYEFIEAEIKVMRAAFRSKRIHLGMDETYGVEGGKYRKLHGERKVIDVYCEHLERVLDITKKYFEEPMIWSDMLFLGESPWPYYSKDFVVPDETLERTPKDVSLVFWDYYNDSYDFYNENFIQHKRFDNPIAFAGGIWILDGYAPYWKFSYKNSVSALKACIDHGIKTVIITEWGGSECSFERAIAGIAIYSEYCYKGKDCTEDDIFRVTEKLCGVTHELWDVLSDYHLGHKHGVKLGNGIFYVDPLFDLLYRDENIEEAIPVYENALRVINSNTNYQYYSFYQLLFSILKKKTELLVTLRPAYEARNYDVLKTMADSHIPELVKLYEEFYSAFKQEWKEQYKPFGLEVRTILIAGAIQRLKDSIEIINDYLTGKSERIEELETPKLQGINKVWRNNQSYMNTIL